MLDAGIRYTLEISKRIEVSGAGLPYTQLLLPVREETVFNRTCSNKCLKFIKCYT